MIRIATVSAFAALLVASVAQAAPAPAIPVQIAGRSVAQVRQDIIAAATQSCAVATHDDVFNEYDSQEGCEDATVAAAYKKLASSTGYAAGDDRLALASPGQ